MYDASKFRPKPLTEDIDQLVRFAEDITRYDIEEYK